MKSLKNQTINDFEAIVVDYGSTDGTVGVVKEIAAGDSRFKLITLKNSNPAEARNAGIKAACGDYLAFLDANDSYTRTFLKAMYDTVKKYSADMAVGRMMSFDSFGTHTFSSSQRLSKRFTTHRFDKDFIWNPSLSNKLFRREKVLAMGLSFGGAPAVQESLFTVEYALNCNEIACCRWGFSEYRAAQLIGDERASSAEDYLEAYSFLRSIAKEAFAKAIETAQSDFEKEELQRRCDNYVDELYLKEITLIINQFYRYFWLLSDDEITQLCNIITYLVSRASQNAQTKILNWNSDIFVDETLIGTKSGMSKSAKITIALSGERTAEQLKTELDYLFAQKVPSFRLYVYDELKDIFPSQLSELCNVSFVTADNQSDFKNKVLGTADTDYIFFLDEFTMINQKTLQRHYNTICRNEEFVFTSSPVSGYVDGQVLHFNAVALAYSYEKAINCISETASYVFDLHFCNKLFNTELLRELKITFSDNSTFDMYAIYRDSIFKRLGFDGFYIGGDENSYLSELSQSLDKLPPECVEFYNTRHEKYADMKRKKPFTARVKSKIKSALKKNIERANRMLCCIFSRLPLKNRALFYTIRAEGTLLENSKTVYDALDADKLICAHAIPHSIKLKPIIYYHLLTNKVIVTDDYNRYLRSIKLRPEQKVIQIWHAGGAFKRFGLDAPSILTRHEEIDTHSQYDAVIVTSEYCRQFYAHAFGIGIDKVLPLGMPRTDSILSEKSISDLRRNIYAKHPELKGKKVLSYFPTFRELNGKRYAYDPQIDWDKLNNSLRDDEVFVIHKHPVMPENFLGDSKYDKIKDFSKDKTSELSAISSVIITDYSSVIFDTSLLNLPTVFYCPDFDMYERDFYVRYPEDLPGPVVYDDDELISALHDAIDKPDTERLKEFRHKFMGACDGKSSKRVVELIKSYLNN